MAIDTTIFGAESDDLHLFATSGRSHLVKLQTAAGACRVDRQVACIATGHEPSQNSVSQLDELAGATEHCNRFVDSVWCQLESGIHSVELRNGMLGPIWSSGEPTNENYLEDRADSGGSLTWEQRGHLARASSPHSAIQRGFGSMSDNSQIGTDEFEAVIHENGNVTLILPGVTDLSTPHLGYDPTSRSVRDLDQVAIPSAFSSRVEDNEYAGMVSAFVDRAIDDEIIDQGANVLIVGHSFGADAALDLAASPSFNGEMVNVTHVVAAAYHSEPQIDDVVGSTQVAVLQNIYDVPVLAEGVVMDAAVLPPWRKGGRWGAGLRAVGRLAVEGAELGLDVVTAGAVGRQSATGGIVGDRVTPIAPNGVVVEFEGGLGNFGHHPEHYVRYLSEQQHGRNRNPLVHRFMDGIGESGYQEQGRILAVDVSVPIAR